MRDNKRGTIEDRSTDAFTVIASGSYDASRDALEIDPYTPCDVEVSVTIHNTVVEDWDDAIRSALACLGLTDQDLESVAQKRSPTLDEHAARWARFRIAALDLFRSGERFEALTGAMLESLDTYYADRY